MSQADQTVTFAIDATTTDFLRGFIGSPQERLDEISARLMGAEALLFFVRNFEEEYAPSVLQQALAGIELVLHDCQALAEVRPLAPAVAERAAA